VLPAVLAVLAGSGPATAATWDRPLADPVPYHRDSGLLANETATSRVVHRETVHVDGAGWIRLYFGEVQLGSGSFLRITSTLDNEVQELDANALVAWSHTSAYFNGDRVVVDLVAGPGTPKNSVVIEQVASEAAVVPLAGCDPGCCGPTDDRVPSTEDWASRLLPAGCTASIYNSASCAVSAGHCVGGGMVLEFKVPLSSPNCNLNHPPIQEQFPVTGVSFTNGGIGQDWAVMTVGTNNVGQTPFQRYGLLKPIADTPPVVGQPVTVWGFGVDDQCTLTQTQQTSSGDIAVVEATALRYNVDVTFGNSGSGVVRNGTEIVGIVTHCCCPNWGTRVDHPSFVAARDSLCPTGVPEAADLLSATVIQGTPISGGVSELVNSDNQYWVVHSVLAGVRHNALTEVTAQSPSTTAVELSVRVEFGPADGSPVFYGLQIFNDDQGVWENLNFGIVSTSTDTVVDSGPVASPNAHISATGQIRVRVLQTARSVQIPNGFTMLADQVLVTVVH
jgi:hypothetical protein